MLITRLICGFLYKTSKCKIWCAPYVSFPPEFYQNWSNVTKFLTLIVFAL